MWLVSGGGGTRRRSPIATASESGSYTGLAASSADPAQTGRQRRGAVVVVAALFEHAAEVGGGVAVAPVLEHPREQLVGGLLGREVGLVGRLRKQEPRLELEQRGDQDEELGRRLEVELAGLLEPLDVDRTSSARSSSRRSISSRRTTASSRSNGPAKTSRSSSTSAVRMAVGVTAGRLGAAAVAQTAPNSPSWSRLSGTWRPRAAGRSPAARTTRPARARCCRRPARRGRGRAPRPPPA